MRVVCAIAGLAAVLAALATPSLAGEPTVAAGTVVKWAVVAADGSLQRGSGVVSSARRSAGEYEVVFNRGVGGCAFNASSALDINARSSFVATAKLAGNSAGVLVDVWNDSGAPSDDAFHLQVTCGRRALFAVVDATGLRKRGRHVVSTQAFGGGTYQVAFDRDVSACAVKATLGSVDTHFPTVGYITVARRVDPSLVVVQTSNFFGAGENRAFHLAVECSSLAARVNADGTLAGGNGAIASQLIQDHYRVTFDRDISACSWVATAAEGISRGVPAPAAMGIYGNGPDAVYVATADGAQSPFNLVVDC